LFLSELTAGTEQPVRSGSVAEAEGRAEEGPVHGAGQARVEGMRPVFLLVWQEAGNLVGFPQGRFPCASR